MLTGGLAASTAIPYSRGTPQSITEKRNVVSSIGRRAVMHRMLLLCRIASIPFVLACGVATADPASFLTVAPSSFNPSLGQQVTISVATPSEARIAVQVLDRDGYVVRTLERSAAAAGRETLRWDGRDDKGAVVADEAYSFKATMVTPHETLTFFPAAHPAKSFAVQADQYSRRNAALMYELPVAARIHAQAGAAALNEKKVYDGPVLKTLVNREPRPAGKVVESWNGLDESGRIYVPDVPHFVTAILATPLPEQAVIAYGNRARTFLDTAATRSGTSLLPAHAHGAAQHHAGLSALEDLSPSLTVTPVGAKWDEKAQTWNFGRGTAVLKVELSGPTAAAVSKQPARIVVFVDYVRQLELSVREKQETIRIPRHLLKGNPRSVTVNWQSTRGPLAANTVRLSTGPAEAQHATR